MEDTARLKVIFKLLEGKVTIISEFDREICSLCEESDVEREVEEAENVTAKIIDHKCRIDDALKPRTGGGSATVVTPATPDSPGIARA